MKRRRLTLLFRGRFALWAVLGVLLTFASCEDTSGDDQDVTFLIGVSQANLSEPWRISMTHEISDEASKHPEVRVIVTDAADSSTRQITDVQRMLALGIDLLIISPNESAALTPIVTEAYSRIPVIVLDRAVEGYNYTLYIGPDNALVGKEAGKYVADLLGPEGGKVIEVLGRRDSPPAADRSSGFLEGLQSEPKIKVVDHVTADWIRDRAEDLLTPRLKQVPKPDVIFAQNDAMAYGAWKAAQTNGLSKVAIIGIDGLSGQNGGIDLVKRGILSATFVCPTGGREAVTYALDILNKKEGIPKKIYLRVKKITKDNVNSYTQIPPQPIFNQSRPIKVGFVQVGRESHWRLANTESIVSAARRAGIALTMVDGRQKQETQIEGIRQFIRERVDVIALSPIVESGWETVLREAKQAGIPVILSDREVDLKDESLWASFLGSDFMEEGRRAARWLTGYMAGRMPEDGVVDIVELRGTEGSAPALDRKRGFEEVIKNNAAFRIDVSEVANFYFDQGKEVMAKILREHPGKIDAIFAHNDDMALGAIESIEAAGLKPGTDIVIVSVDAVKEAFEAMIAGKLNCTVECTPLLGPQLMKVIGDYANGVELPTRIITSEEVFPADSAREALPRRRY